MAVELLADRLDDPEPTAHAVRMQAQLVVRNSTAAIDPRRSAVRDRRPEHGNR